MIGDVFRGIAAVGLGTVAVWMGALATVPQHVHFLKLPAFLQSETADSVQRVTTGELTRRVTTIESGNFDHRLTIVETTETEILKRLDSIDSLERATLLGLVAVVFKTIWELIARIKRGFDEG